MWVTVGAVYWIWKYRLLCSHFHIFLHIARRALSSKKTRVWLVLKTQSVSRVVYSTRIEKSIWCTTLTKTKTLPKLTRLLLFICLCGRPVQFWKLALSMKIRCNRMVHWPPSQRLSRLCWTTPRLWLEGSRRPDQEASIAQISALHSLLPFEAWRRRKKVRLDNA